MTNRVQTLRSSVKGQRPVEGTRQVGELFVNFADLQFGFINPSKIATDLVAIRYFSSSTDYAAGDFVVQEGVLYKATGAVPAGPFDPADWTRSVTTIDLALKEDVIVPGTVSQYWRGDKTWQVLDKAAVGLSNVNNTADSSKPISTDTQAALDLKVNRAGDTMGGHLGLPAGPAGSQAVRRDYVDAADQSIIAALAAKANLASPTFTGDPKAPTPPPGDNDTSIATTAFVTQKVITGTQGFVMEAPIDGIQYVRSDATWEPVVVPEETAIGDVPPAGPKPGQIWYESDTGDTHVWYDDGTSQQWVQINSGISPGAGGAEPGQVAWFAMNAPPYGWLKANGAAVSRSAYAKLFAAIGITFGAGNTATTFNIPDLRGEFIRGYDDGREVDPARVFGTAQAPNIQSHAHTASGGNHSHTGTTGDDTPDHANLVTGNTGYISADHTHYTSFSNIGTGQGTGPGADIADYNYGSAKSNNYSSGVTANHYHSMNFWSGGANTRHKHPFTTATADVTPTIAAAGVGVDTRPRNVALLACIRY